MTNQQDEQPNQQKQYDLSMVSPEHVRQTKIDVKGQVIHLCQRQTPQGERFYLIAVGNEVPSYDQVKRRFDEL